jgi:hypothetical protein
MNFPLMLWPLKRGLTDIWTQRKVFDCGSLTHDAATIKSYRGKSLEYFKHVLCGEGEYPDLSSFSEELQNALRCWDEVACHIRAVCSKCKSTL